MITVHGRTRCQMFKGKLTGSLSKVKSKLQIPVLVNVTSKVSLTLKHQ